MLVPLVLLVLQEVVLLLVEMEERVELLGFKHLRQ
jgi:hypothetical protein